MGAFELVVFHRATSRVFSLPARGAVSIGRDAEQEIRIDDPSVSRRHATLTIEAGHVFIEDNGSANGTKLVRAKSEETSDGVPTCATPMESVAVHGPVAVRHGDSIQIGGAVLVLRHIQIVKESPMAALERLVAQIAPSDIRVLCIGETGVGKELLAERIHRASRRAAGPLLRLHCGALSETLLESELFGHARGAFTGAIKAHVGVIEAAHGGTLFLDEVGEMSPAVQVKLLRVLEDGKVRPVGSSESRSVDVRIVSATHRELAEEVRVGRFRQDLYFRLNGITLRMPPLRERRGEIVPLAKELLARAARQANREPPLLEHAACSRLLAYEWPGNVRELRQVMERALALSSGGSIGVVHLLLEESFGAGARSATSATPLKVDMLAVERRRIEDALAACGGNQSRAAAMLNMPRRTLVDRLRSWGKTRPRVRHT